MFLSREKLIPQGKNVKQRPKNLQLNNVTRQIAGFCISYFAAFMNNYHKVKNF